MFIKPSSTLAVNTRSPLQISVLYYVLLYQLMHLLQVTLKLLKTPLLTFSRLMTYIDVVPHR